VPSFLFFHPLASVLTITASPRHFVKSLFYDNHVSTRKKKDKRIGLTVCVGYFGYPF
jgi:hypothetical protein